jgi:hypothetical protein
VNTATDPPKPTGLSLGRNRNPIVCMRRNGPSQARRLVAVRLAADAARGELALGREPDAPGLVVMGKPGFSGACGLDAGLRIMTHEHNGEEPGRDQSDKCHEAKKVLHDHPPF